MPPPINPEELGTIGKAAIGAIESHVDSPFINKWVPKIFGLDSNLTGDSGAKLKNYLKFGFEASRDMHTGQAFKSQEAYHANPQAFELKVKAQGAKAPKYDQIILNTKGQAAPFQLKGAANMQARNEKMGPNDEVAAGFINAIAQEHGAQRGSAAGEMKAKNVVDALGIYFHDSAYDLPRSGQDSRLAHNLNAKDSLVEDIRFNPSKYTPPQDDFERNLYKYSASALASHAGLKHTSTILNSLIGRTFSSAAKASTSLFGKGYEATRAEMLSLNAVGQIFAEEHQQAYDFEHGIIKRFAPNSFGEFVSKNWAIPGLTAVRQRTAAMFAAQGKFAAQELAERLQHPDMKVAENAKFDLRRLGINPDKVKMNNFTLDSADIRNAMFHNTNDRMFLQSGMNRSTAATSTITGRLFGQYHAYQASQANFIQRELMASIAKRDPIGAVKTITLLGTLFPMVGASIGALSAIWGGKHIKDAFEEGKENAGLVEGNRMAGLIKGLSDTAGFGVMEGYYRATMRRKLANQMGGALANTGEQLLEDTAAAIHGAVTGVDKHKTKYQARTYYPLVRDLIHDVPSASILPIAAELLDIAPKQDELNKRKPKTAKQKIANIKRAAKRKIAKGR